MRLVAMDTTISMWWGSKTICQVQPVVATVLVLLVGIVGHVRASVLSTSAAIVMMVVLYNRVCCSSIAAFHAGGICCHMYHCMQKNALAARLLVVYAVHQKMPGLIFQAMR